MRGNLNKTSTKSLGRVSWLLGPDASSSQPPGGNGPTRTHIGPFWGRCPSWANVAFFVAILVALALVVTPVLVGCGDDVGHPDDNVATPTLGPFSIDPPTSKPTTNRGPTSDPGDETKPDAATEPTTPDEPTAYVPSTDGSGPGDTGDSGSDMGRDFVDPPEPPPTKAPLGPKSTIVLVVNPWNGSEANVAVASQLLESELGYTVETTYLDENAQWAAINAGDADASLEVWPSGHAHNVADYIDSSDGNVDYAGPLGPIGGIGWFIPTYMVEEYPELATWEGLADPELARLFAVGETGDKGRLLSGDASWTTYDEQIVANLNLPLDVVYIGFEAEILDVLESAYSRREPILVYLWTPHSAFHIYDLTKVALPAHSDECYAKYDDGGIDCAYPEEVLFKIVNADLSDSAPDADAFLRAMNYSTADQASILSAIENDGLSVEEAADQWIANNEATRGAWLPFF